MKPSSSDSPDRDRVATRLHSVAIRMLRLLRQEDEAAGLSAARLSAMSVVVFGGPVSLGRLAAAEQVAAPTMSRMVRSLEAEGLVTRSPDPADGRSVLIEATPRGRALLEEGRARRVRRLVEILDELDDDDLQAVERATGLLEEVLARP